MMPKNDAIISDIYRASVDENQGCAGEPSTCTARRHLDANEQKDVVASADSKKVNLTPEADKQPKVVIEDFRANFKGRQLVGMV